MLDVNDMSRRLPTVSIVVPTFNRAHLLPISVDSVRAQTFGDWELLLVDDHSTDDTRELIEGWSEDDPRIRYLINENIKGPAGARNTGVDHCSGKYVAFLDSDDEWLPHHLERCLHYLDGYPDRIDLVTAAATEKRTDGGVERDRGRFELSCYEHECLDEAYLLDPKTLFDATFRGLPVMVQQTIVVRRDFLNSHGGLRYDETIPPGPEDSLFHRLLAYHRVKVAYLSEAHLIYWAHGDNLSNSGGMTSPTKKLALYLAFNEARLRSEQLFPLTSQQRRLARQRMAKIFVWEVASAGFAAEGRYAEARHYILKGLRLNPLNLRFWKAYFGTFLK